MTYEYALALGKVLQRRGYNVARMCSDGSGGWELWISPAKDKPWYKWGDVRHAAA